MELGFSIGMFHFTPKISSSNFTTMFHSSRPSFTKEFNHWTFRTNSGGVMVPLTTSNALSQHSYLSHFTIPKRTRSPPSPFYRIFFCKGSPSFRLESLFFPRLLGEGLFPPPPCYHPAFQGLGAPKTDSRPSGEGPETHPGQCLRPPGGVTSHF